MLRRLFLALLVGGVLGITVASAAPAVPPSKEPVPFPDVTYPAGLVCSFPVSLHYLENKASAITHFDKAGNVRWIGGHGRLVVRVTNDFSTEAVTLNISGPVKFFLHPDGSVTFEGGGHSIFAFFPTDTPAMSLLLLAGHVVVTASPTGQLTLISHTGSSRDICAELS